MPSNPTIPPDDPKPPMLIVFNPTAGPGRQRNLTRALSALLERGVRAEVAMTRHAGHAEEIARQAVGAGVPVVVAAGGDGGVEMHKEAEDPRLPK